MSALQNEALFISDLHLHPNNPAITERFNAVMDWAGAHTKSLYILGDFFHVCTGEEGRDAWTLAIAKRLKQLSLQGIKLYFMPGNRDFLIGKTFLEAASLQVLKDPSLIYCNEAPVLLSHGDRYCTKDKAHQWFRRITQSGFFIKCFLKLPLALRNHLVLSVRKKSQKKKYHPQKMSTVASEVIKHMQRFQVDILIHGHTHTPGLIEHTKNEQTLKQYILSDWDDRPQLLCYHITKGFYFIQIP